MSAQVSVALVAAVGAVAAAVIAAAGTLLAARTNRTVRNLRDEFQLSHLPDRLRAYRALWALLEPVAPSLPGPVDDDVRLRLDDALRHWYFADGNGIFLSADAQDAFLKARRTLRAREPRPADDAVRDAFSRLRSVLKDDIGVYGGGDLTRQLG